METFEQFEQRDFAQHFYGHLRELQLPWRRRRKLTHLAERLTHYVNQSRALPGHLWRDLVAKDEDAVVRLLLAGGPDLNRNTGSHANRRTFLLEIEGKRLQGLRLLKVLLIWRAAKAIACDESGWLVRQSFRRLIQGVSDWEAVPPPPEVKFPGEGSSDFEPIDEIRDKDLPYLLATFTNKELAQLFFAVGERTRSRLLGALGAYQLYDVLELASFLDPELIELELVGLVAKFKRHFARWKIIYLLELPE